MRSVRLSPQSLRRLGVLMTLRLLKLLLWVYLAWLLAVFLHSYGQAL